MSLRFRVPALNSSYPDAEQEVQSRATDAPLPLPDPSPPPQPPTPLPSPLPSASPSLKTSKLVWVSSTDPDVVAAAKAWSWPTVRFADPPGASSSTPSFAPSTFPAAAASDLAQPPLQQEQQEQLEELERELQRLRNRGTEDYMVFRGVVWRVEANKDAHSEHAATGQGRTGARLRTLPVGVHFRVEKGEDQELLQEFARRTTKNRQQQELWREELVLKIVLLDPVNWKVITAENAVALFQKSQALVMGVATSALDARLLLQALEVGLDGVVLHTDRLDEILLLQNMLATWGSHAAAATDAARDSSSEEAHDKGLAGAVELRWARLTKVAPSGMGHRVCVDLCSLLPPGSGLLLGSFARGMFLVHSECLHSDFVPSRPFRVNAGPVCSYVALPGGRTAYLSELQAGAEVLVVDASSQASSIATVGRAKVEIRPLIFLEAEMEDARGKREGGVVAVFLQNAETVRLVVPRSSDSQEGSGLPCWPSPVGSKSVSELRVGDAVLVAVMEDVGRHTGIAVDEYILER